jgi:hypothetical protein
LRQFALQPILDRHVAGADVPLSEARQVWRNTPQPNCGFAAFYEELFPLVRRINKTLPPDKKLQVPACDPPIDWSKVRRPGDLRPFMDRDRSIAGVMEREVPAKHRKALMLFGISHIRHGTNAVGMYESRYPHLMLVIAEHRGFGGPTPFARYIDTLESRMALWPVPSLVMMKGTWQADMQAINFDPDF